jgi:hypothetical protein
LLNIDELWPAPLLDYGDESTGYLSFQRFILDLYSDFIVVEYYQGEPGLGQRTGSQADIACAAGESERLHGLSAACRHIIRTAVAARPMLKCSALLDCLAERAA